MKYEQLILLLFFVIIFCVNGSIDHNRHVIKHLNRNKRVIPSLPGGGMGYIVAVALPLALGAKKVFQAFNFEVHYALADNNTFSPKVVEMLLKGKRSTDEHEINDNNLIEKPNKNTNKILFTRKHMYHIIVQHLNYAGYNGTGCLMKTICEASIANLHINNGVLGNIFHIIFSPSSSKHETIPMSYYEAEETGRYQSDCTNYDEYCPESILDYITTTGIGIAK